MACLPGNTSHTDGLARAAGQQPSDMLLAWGHTAHSMPPSPWTQPADWRKPVSLMHGDNCITCDALWQPACMHRTPPPRASEPRSKDTSCMRRHACMRWRLTCHHRLEANALDVPPPACDRGLGTTQGTAGEPCLRQQTAAAVLRCRPRPPTPYTGSLGNALALAALVWLARAALQCIQSSSLTG